MQSIDGHIEQVGIVSWGPGETCGTVNAPMVYAKVSGYIDWISRNIA